jgi:hypothetical protein
MVASEAASCALGEASTDMPLEEEAEKDELGEKAPVVARRLSPTVQIPTSVDALG